jgi:hypothetical protein
VKQAIEERKEIGKRNFKGNSYSCLKKIVGKMSPLLLLFYFNVLSRKGKNLQFMGDLAFM